MSNQRSIHVCKTAPVEWEGGPPVVELAPFVITTCSCGWESAPMPARQAPWRTFLHRASKGMEIEP